MAQAKMGLEKVHTLVAYNEILCLTQVLPGCVGRELVPCRDCKRRELITMNVGRGPYVLSPQVCFLALLHIFLPSL